MSTSKSKRLGVFDLLLVVLSALFLAGLCTVLRACAAMEDGSWMSCHWAQQALIGIALVMVAIALIHLFVRDKKVKLGLDCALVLLCVLSALTPVHLIQLCLMDTMRCHAIMKPAAQIFSALIGVVALIDGVLMLRGSTGQQ